MSLGGLQRGRLQRGGLQPRWALLLVALAGAGCRGSESRAAAVDSAMAVRVLDGLGRALRLERPARRIAALSPSNCEIAFAIGCGGRLVLRDRASDYPPAARFLPATDPFRLSVDHIAGFSPDLLLASHLDASRVAGLAAVGLPVAVFDPSTVARTLQDVLAIGQLCGRPQAARRWVSRAQGRLRRLRAQVERRGRPRVYIELDGSDPLKPWTVGAGSLVNDVVRLAGGRNVFDDLERSAAQVGVEEVLHRAPEVVLLAWAGTSTRGRLALAERPGWPQLPALRHGRVVDAIDAALLTRPGPRLVDGVEALARRLHPGAFDGVASRRR